MSMVCILIGRSELAVQAQRRQPGRPAGASDARNRIVNNARDLFARNGIDKTSIRAIASAAGVDPALVHHYFGAKRQLFAAATEVPIDPTEILTPLLETPVAELGYTIPRLLLPLWDSEAGKGVIAKIRSLSAGSEVWRPHSFLQEVIMAQIAPRVDHPLGSGTLRVQFVASQLVGVLLARYIFELDPFKSLAIHQIAETIGPTLQYYLTADLSGFCTNGACASCASVWR